MWNNFTYQDKVKKFHLFFKKVLTSEETSLLGGEKMNNLKEVREKANLTQEQLANLINVDRSTITKWETGEASPRSDKLPMLAKVLDCRIDDLF